MWVCLCDCGKQRIWTTSAMLRGVVQSCGCLARDIKGSWNVTHGATRGSEKGAPRERMYRIWSKMKSRVKCPTCPGYPEYGGRGIAMDPKWETYEGFKEDMFHGYSDNLSIDRIDNDGPYTKSNCRWATPKQQANNTRRNHNITINGVTRTMTEWCKISGNNLGTVWSRIANLGWPPERAIFASKVTPTGRRVGRATSALAPA